MGFGTGELGEYETENKDYFLGRCQDHVFTMLKPHLAYIYFQMGKSSENVKTESIRSKEYVYGVSNFWDPFGPSLDQVGTMFSLPLLLSIFLNNLSVCWFSHVLTQVLQWRICRPLVLFSSDLKLGVTTTNPIHSLN